MTIQSRAEELISNHVAGAAAAAAIPIPLVSSADSTARRSASMRRARSASGCSERCCRASRRAR